MGSVPTEMTDRGPVPGTVIVTRVAEEAMDENTLVTWGTANQSCRKADATDILMGWTAERVVAVDNKVSVHLYSSMWKGIVADDSNTIYDGDALEQSANGEVRRGVVGSGNQIVFYAMDDAVAGTFVLMIYNCCAVATAVES